jgi:hypothetical protein
MLIEKPEFLRSFAISVLSLTLILVNIYPPMVRYSARQLSNFLAILTPCLR